MIRDIPISIEWINMVKRIKAEIAGCSATAWGKFLIRASVLVKLVYTCGTNAWITALLNFQDDSSKEMKTIADRKLIPVNFKGVRYVMPTALTGRGTRSSVMGIRDLKSGLTPKGTVGYRYFSSKGNIDESTKRTIPDVLNDLQEASKTNNMETVNKLVKCLLSSEEFWIGCYESIKSTSGGMAHGDSQNAGEKPQTYDGLDKQWFTDLCKKVKSGKFHFDPMRRVYIPKPDGKSRPLGIAFSGDKIVQKGLATILETVSEFRFYEGSFGFRKKLSTHDAIRFIKKKVPSGVWARGWH